MSVCFPRPDTSCGRDPTCCLKTTRVLAMCSVRINCGGRGSEETPPDSGSEAQDTVRSFWGKGGRWSL